MGEETTVTVITTQVESKGPMPLWQGDKEWTSGLCSCFDDCGICLCGWFCTPCYGCCLASKLGEYCCVPYWTGFVPLRQKVRMMRGIRGSICGDCLVSCCPCTVPCTLCQMAREMKHAGWL